MRLYFFVFATLLSFVLTGILRRYALARSLLDVPNTRSSHSVPTPRGGGVAIVLTVLFGLPLLAWGDSITLHEVIGLWGAGALVAIVGFVDDHGHIPAAWRLLVHFLAVFWALAWIGGLPSMSLFGTLIETGWLLQCFAALYLVWLLNLYNFMDGIDGLASVEAVTTCAGGTLILVLCAPSVLMWGEFILLLAAVLGFLVWNFPRARIFMGDAGSGFLGLMLGLFSVQAAGINPAFFWAWLILLGVFVVDATHTLLQRLMRRQRPHEAHRSHAYQNASRKFGAHYPVTLAVVAINLLWLLPLALGVGLGHVDGTTGLLIAYAPLVWLCFHFKAGAVEARDL